MSRPALFLDRDGVINVDHGYVCRAENFDFIDGIFGVCREARRRGYALVVVTNQAGIGRGYYTETVFHELTEWMRAAFAEQDAALDAVYFCPHHPEHGIGAYRIDSPDRKPAPGMLLRAARELDLDLAASLLIGDKESDVQAGRAAGVGCTLLFRPSGGADSAADAVIRRLDEALPFLTHERRDQAFTR